MYYREEQSSAREAGDLIGGRYLQEDGPAPSDSHCGGMGGGTILWLFNFWSSSLKEGIVCDMFILGKRQCFG